MGFKHDPRVAHLVGQTLAREWKGTRHEVSVEADGYYYDGRHFTSLSSLGKHITGRSTNGFEFFNLLGKGPTLARAPAPSTPPRLALMPDSGPSAEEVAVATTQVQVARRAGGIALIPRAIGARRRARCTECSCDHQAANPERGGCCCGAACSAYKPEPAIHYALPSGKAECGATDLHPGNRSWMKAYATCEKCVSRGG